MNLIKDSDMYFSGTYGLKLTEDSGSNNPNNGIGIDNLGSVTIEYSKILENDMLFSVITTIDQNISNSYTAVLQLNEDSNVTLKTVPNISIGTIGLPNMFESLFTTNGAGITSDSKNNLISIMYDRKFNNNELSIRIGLNNIKTTPSVHGKIESGNSNAVINKIKETSNYLGGQLELQYNSESLGEGVIGLKIGEESTNLITFGDSKSNGLFMSYKYGKLSLGLEKTTFDLDRKENDIRQTAFSFGFSLNKDLSFSYQSMIIDSNTVGQLDEKINSINASYIIRKTLINARYSKIKNDDFVMKNDLSHIDLGIIFYF